MKFTKTLFGILLAGSAATSACGEAGYSATVVAYEEPPPPLREEIVTYQPGFIWVHGNWMRDYNNRWAWHGGYYERERAGYVYEPGRWDRRGRNYMWVGGTWHARGGVVVRRRH